MAKKEDKMTRFLNFKTYNKYIGVAQPLDNDVDLGYYDSPNMLLKSDPIIVDFYRISIKINFIDKLTTDAKPITAVFFNSPEFAAGWNVEPTYTGMYVQLSKKYVEKNRVIFKHFLNCGQNEAMHLTENEVIEISAVFGLMIKYYNREVEDFAVLLAYVNVFISLVETFYSRKFVTNPKQCNRIVTDFQQILKNYYNQPVDQLPTVQYFADKLGLTPNYFGDIVKQFTKRTAIEKIHKLITKKAKEMLEKRSDLNTTEIAHELGFEYPNYFAKFFKKQVNLTPKQYRLQMNAKQFKAESV